MAKEFQQKSATTYHSSSGRHAIEDHEHLFKNLLKSANYEYFRKEFLDAKDRLTSVHSFKTLANPKTNLSKQNSAGLFKYEKTKLMKPPVIISPTFTATNVLGTTSKLSFSYARSLSLLVIKAATTVFVVYTTYKLGVWGTVEETRNVFGAAKENIKNLKNVATSISLSDIPPVISVSAENLLKNVNERAVELQKCCEETFVAVKDLVKKSDK